MKISIEKLGFTPGPWRKAKSGNPFFRLAVIAPDGVTVCHITQWNEDEKNQSLITAAPEMLEALIKFKSDAEGYGVDTDPELVDLVESHLNIFTKLIEKIAEKRWEEIKEIK